MIANASVSRWREWVATAIESGRAGQGVARAWPLLALIGACLLTAVACGTHLWLTRLRQEDAAVHFDLRGRLSLAQALAKTRTPAAPESDFTQSLPATISVDAFVQSVQQSAEAFNVVMANVNSEPRKETSQSMPRLDVTLVLRGSYAGIKSTLSEALSRYPNAVVQQLSLKRDSTLPGNEEATIQLMLLLRPGAGLASSS